MDDGCKLRMLLRMRGIVNKVFEWKYNNIKDDLFLVYILHIACCIPPPITEFPAFINSIRRILFIGLNFSLWCDSNKYLYLDIKGTKLV